MKDYNRTVQVHFLFKEQNICPDHSKMKQQLQLPGQTFVALPFDTDVQFPFEKNFPYTIWKIK